MLKHQADGQSEKMIKIATGFAYGQYCWFRVKEGEDKYVEIPEKIVKQWEMLEQLVTDHQKILRDIDDELQVIGEFCQKKKNKKRRMK